MEKPEFALFFELPGELREQILAHLVVKPAGIHIGERHCFPRATGLPGDTESDENGDGSDNDDDKVDDHNHDETDNGMGWPANYFLVNSIFYKEASSLFFGENTFHLYAGVRRSILFDPLSELGVLAPLWQQSSHRKGPADCGSTARYHLSRRRLKRVILYIQRLGGSLGDVIAPCLQDMVLNGDLRHLDIRVYHLEQQGCGRQHPRLFCEQEAGGSDAVTRQWATVDVEEISR
ncbi:hypothetical protein diail_11663, partial [Diaporthe ilicicola]